MEENNQALFEEEFEMPSRPLETLKRMWNSVEEQHGRLLVVFVSVIFYTLLSILAPVYSAGIIDLLWEKIQEAARGGGYFPVLRPSEFSYGQFCRTPQPEAEDRYQSETGPASPLLL